MFSKGCHWCFQYDMFWQCHLASSRHESPFSTTVEVEVRTVFSLVPVSLYCKHERISLPIRGFWELLYFFNFFSFLFHFINLHMFPLT